MARSSTHTQSSGADCSNGNTDCVGDRMWLWCHPAGSHNGSKYGIPSASRTTPVEACNYLGIRNALVVRYGDFGPFPPYDQFAVPFATLDRVVWSIVGAGGRTDEETREAVLELAGRMPNITGVIMDDFFRASRGTEGLTAALSQDELQEVTDRLTLPDRRLDLWVVLYDHQLGYEVGPYLDRCDKVTFWTWQAENLANLEADYARAESLTPRHSRLLGCYMWDYGNSRPMPVELMRRQCEYGLELLRSGRIEGMIFLASCICDLQLEAVEWTRRWIAANSPMPL